MLRCIEIERVCMCRYTPYGGKGLPLLQRRQERYWLELPRRHGWKAPHWHQRPDEGPCPKHIKVMCTWNWRVYISNEQQFWQSNKYIYVFRIKLTPSPSCIWPTTEPRDSPWSLSREARRSPPGLEPRSQRLHRVGWTVGDLSREKLEAAQTPRKKSCISNFLRLIIISTKILLITLVNTLHYLPHVPIYVYVYCTTLTNNMWQRCSNMYILT